MLERYCQALGIDVFNADAYGPDYVLIDSGEPLPRDALVLTLEQAQQRLGIVPDTAHLVPG
jgi:hypothetical protein